MCEQNPQQQLYSVVLSIKIHLHLVNYCLICGTSLKGSTDSSTSNLVNPLNHILNSSCFVKQNGEFGIKDIKLYQDGNESISSSTEKENIEENQNILISDNESEKEDFF